MTTFEPFKGFAAAYTDTNGNVFSYTISNSMVYIKGYTGTNDVVIPAEINGYPVTNIAKEAFKSKSITSITIPNTIEYIGEDAFLYCSALEHIYIDDISAWCKINFYDEASQPMLYAEKMFLNGNILTDLTVPSSVTSIGKYAFAHCSSLINVTLSNSITQIGAHAFDRCTNLQNINIPDTVSYIGNCAFWQCSKLEKICIPDNITEIQGQTFEGCTALKEVKLSSNLKLIGNMAFSRCGFSNIDIPYGVTTINISAFSGCTALKEIVIPSSVTSIGDNAFTGCDSLIDVEIPNSITYIPCYMFYNCANLESAKIPKSVTKLGYRIFMDCPKLTDIYYEGNEEEWDNIELLKYKYYVDGYYDRVNMHYNSFTPGDTSPSIIAEIKYNDTTYDLLSQPINIDKESDAEVSVKVNYEGGTGKEKIYISQNTEKATELENNTYKTFKPTEIFDVGKDIYILVVNEETGDSFSKRTRLKIVDNTANGEWLPDGNIEGLNFKLGKEIGFTIPENVAVFGGTEIKWDFDFIPITVEYDKEDNNKIKILYGFNPGGSLKDSFDGYKKEIKSAIAGYKRSDKQLRNDFIMTNAYNPKMNLFGGKVIGGGSGKPDFDAKAIGYAEGRIDDGKLEFIEGQFCINLEVSYTYKGQIFVSVVPFYYEIGGGIGAGFEGNMINIAPESFVPEFEAYLTAKVSAKLGAGLGIPKIASIGIAGNGSLNLKKALHKEYLKAWGEGTADFNMKILGKEVYKSDFAKGDFLIYETGNANGLISDSAVKLASLEDEDVYSGIDINKVYENESSLYNSAETVWYGDISPISWMTTDYTNKNMQLLAKNIYAESTPMICDIDGQKVMVLTQLRELNSNDPHDALNRIMLAYSVYDNETNSWSAPIPVCDDGKADFYPCFNDGYLVWQNEKSLLNNSMTLSDIAKLGEICVSKWNGSGFDEPVTITDNSVIDTQPFVCSSDSEVSVVWTTNSENSIIGTSGKNTILKSNMADSNWNDAVIVKDNLNSIVNLSAGYTDTGLNIAYVVDGDNDLQTINERDIYIITENEEYKLTDNDVLDSNPVFEGNIIYYYSNGNVEYGVLGDTGKDYVFEKTKAGLTDNFTVDANETGDVAIWWAENTDDATEIFCALYKDGEWSDEIQISDTGNQSKYPAGVLESDGSMYVAYNNSIWQDGSVSQSDLYTIDLLPSYDLSVVDAYIDEDSMMVYATIKNTGELNIDSYTLSLIDGDVNSQKVISEGLKAGESVDVEIEYIKPENLDKRTITLSVAIDDEEYNLDNNSAALTVGNCDVNITEVRNYEKLPTSLAVAVISNNGYSDTGKITVCLRKETADGIVAETQIIDNLSAGESTEVTFNYNIVENSNIQWYVTAESENEEISLGNNDSYFINNYLSSVSEYGHEILRYSIKEKSLVVNAYAENNTATDLNAVSILAVYGADGRLKGLKQSDLAAVKYGNDTLNFTIDDYSYSNGDYIKLFMWDRLNSLEPVCTAIQTNIIQ